MEDRLFHPLVDDNDSFGTERYMRDMPPAHYTLKMDSFTEISKLLQDAKVWNYKSDVFESNGYKWRLYVYPNGNKEENGEGHISLYLGIVGTNNLPRNWEVYVNFKLFVYDHIRDMYMTIQDANGKMRRFHNMKTEWGFARLLPLSCFNDATKGYLVHDKCIFGAEVFVTNYGGSGESVAILEGPSKPFTWKIEKFSSLDNKFYYSDAFTAANRNWNLLIYPKGNSGYEGESLSLYVHSTDIESFPSGRKAYAKYLLRVRDQLHNKHVEVKGTACFSTSKFPSWGSASIVSLRRLHDASAGFLVNDTLIVEGEIQRVCTVKNF